MHIRMKVKLGYLSVIPPPPPPPKMKPQFFGI